MEKNRSVTLPRLGRSLPCRPSTRLPSHSPGCLGAGGLCTFGGKSQPLAGRAQLLTPFSGLGRAAPAGSVMHRAAITDSDTGTQALPVSPPSASPAALGSASPHPRLGACQRPAFECPHCPAQPEASPQRLAGWPAFLLTGDWTLASLCFVAAPQTGEHP